MEGLPVLYDPNEQCKKNSGFVVVGIQIIVLLETIPYSSPGALEGKGNSSIWDAFSPKCFFLYVHIG